MKKNNIAVSFRVAVGMNDSVMLSEAKHLWIFCAGLGSEEIRDSSLRSE
jgi:hypothetical protein